MAQNNVKFYQSVLNSPARIQRLLVAGHAGCTGPTDQEIPHKAQTIRSIEMVMKPRRQELKEVGQALCFCTFGILATVSVCL